MNNKQWQCGRYLVDLTTPKVMGIVNITPDSFSDGGVYSSSVKTTLQHAQLLLQQGADILDIGGESTRPGSNYVSPEEEWLRVEPILKEVCTWNVPISLDTRRTFIMEKALSKGYVDIINDVSALSDEGAVNLLAQHANIGICLMHMQGLPQDMQNNPQYKNLVNEIIDYLKERVNQCIAASIAQERMVLDPGFGFGKTLQHNILLMQHLNDLGKATQLPLLVGVSRKSMIGELSGQKKSNLRVHGSVAAALAAIARGAKIIRVHDVAATVEAIKVWLAIGMFKS